MLMYETELQHHGIKGQRWGIRRFQNKDGSLTPLGRKRNREVDDDYETHEDYKKAHGSKSVKSMSDKELRERINRIQMEQQYRNLTKKKSVIDSGKKVVGEIIANAAKETVKNYVRQYMTNKIDMEISKAAKNAASKTSKNVMDKFVETMTRKK